MQILVCMHFFRKLSYRILKHSLSDLNIIISKHMLKAIGFQAKKMLL